VSEPYTGSKAWDFQVSFPHILSTSSQLTVVNGQESLDNARHCGVRIDAAQDSTLCSSGTGGASEHPVYLHTAINAGATKRGEMGGMAVVAFLPAFKRESTPLRAGPRSFRLTVFFPLFQGQRKVTMNTTDATSV